MTKDTTSPNGSYTVDGIEVVELSDVDVEFAFGEAARQGPPPTLETTATAPTKPDELAKVPLYNGVGRQDVEAIAPQCQSIHAVPGYVLVAPGRLNTKTFFVLEGQLRVYPQNSDRRPIAIADVGQSTGLRAALIAQPANHSVIATEVSHLVAIELAVLNEAAKRSHVLARNYAELLASYIRGDNCLHIGAHAVSGAAREGYVDELTLLHNEHWLASVLPRLVARCQLAHKPLAVTAFAIDKLDEITKTHGAAAGLRVLQAVGHWLLDQTRPTDLLAVNKNRYLFAFLPDCNLKAANLLAERLQKSIPTLRVPLPSGKTAEAISVTLSLAAVELENGMKEKEFLTKTEALIQKSMPQGGS